MIQRILLVHLVVIVPLFLFNIFKWNQLNQLKQKQTELKNFSEQADVLSKIEKLNLKTKKRHTPSSPEYLYEKLECYKLTNENSKIQLIETTTSENPFYIEKEEALAQNIQVDLKDLRQLLKKIEGGDIKDKPHLFFKEFSIKKNKHSESIAYDFNFKLIKRDYLK